MSTPASSWSLEPTAPMSVPWAVRPSNFSTTQTLAPSSAADWAAVQPAMPAPTTTTS